MIRSRLFTSSVLMAAVAVLSVNSLSASGPLGMYGIVERVVFEPNEAAPERIQLWGAFAYVDGGSPQGLTVSPAARGYLYFKAPDIIAGFTTQRDVDNVKTEWADFKSVAGTGQAVGFGNWGYIAGFSALRPDAQPNGPSVILARAPRGGATTDLRVRPETERPASPATYQTNAGIVKISDQGSHAGIVRQLREALKTTSK
jgi:hypothetical protein